MLYQVCYFLISSVTCFSNRSKLGPSFIPFTGKYPLARSSTFNNSNTCIICKIKECKTIIVLHSISLLKVYKLLYVFFDKLQGTSPKFYVSYINAHFHGYICYLFLSCYGKQLIIGCNKLIASLEVFCI